MNDKDYGDPVVGAMLGLCVGYYLAHNVTPEEISNLALEQAKMIQSGSHHRLLGPLQLDPLIPQEIWVAFCIECGPINDELVTYEKARDTMREHKSKHNTHTVNVRVRA